MHDCHNLKSKIEKIRIPKESQHDKIENVAG
jgi:hypothetical protein